MFAWAPTLTRERVGLWAAIALGVALRLSHIGDPYLADFHAWRQADTAAFAHGYLNDSLDPFDPSIDRYPCEHRATPFGRVESEWPGVQWLSALPLAALGQDYPPPWYLRSVSILFYVLTCLYLAALVQRLDGNATTALISVLAFSVLPLSIFFTRTVQPDGPSLCFAVGMLFHLDSWLDRGRSSVTREPTRWRQSLHAFASGAFASLALLVKISNAFMGVPAVYVILRRQGLVGAVRNASLWVWGVFALLPVVFWYRHAREFAWSFGIWGDRGASKFTDIAYAKDLEIWKRLGERQVHEILTWGGLVLLLVGVSSVRRSPSARLAAVWLVAVAFFIIATLKGNNRHIYYQLPMVLPAAVLIAQGVWTLLQGGVLTRVVLVACCVVHVGITYEVLWGDGQRLGVEPYFRADEGLIEGVRLIRAHVPEGGGFVSTDRHPGLFYNSGRRGYFTSAQPRAFMTCASGTTRFLLLDRAGRRELTRLLKSRPRLRNELRELGRGNRYSIWTYDPPPAPRSPS